VTNEKRIPTNRNQKCGIPGGVAINMMRINACHSTLVLILTRLPTHRRMKKHGNQNATGSLFLGAHVGKDLSLSIWKMKNMEG